MVLIQLLKWTDKGRRRELITGAVLYGLGALITSNAPDVNVLLVGRLLYGLGIGLVSFLNFCSIYSADFAMCFIMS